MAEQPQYHPKDAITPAVKDAGITGAAGLLVASIQSTLTKRNIGALGPITHYGGTIATFGMTIPSFYSLRIVAWDLADRH